MNDQQIAELERALTHTGVMWIDPNGLARGVRRVSEPPKEEVPEPSKCAYLDGSGGYVALWNADPANFYLCTPLFD